MIRELAGQSFEADHRRSGAGTDLCHQGVEGGLGAGKAALACATEQFQRKQLLVGLELLEDKVSPGLGDRGAADLAPAAQGRVIGVLDQRLGLDAANLADPDAAALGHVGLGMSSPTEDLDLMAHKQREHGGVMRPWRAVWKGVICRESELIFLHVWPPSKPARLSGMKAARVIQEPTQPADQWRGPCFRISHRCCFL